MARSRTNEGHDGPGHGLDETGGVHVTVDATGRPTRIELRHLDARTRTWEGLNTALSQATFVATTSEPDPGATPLPPPVRALPRVVTDPPPGIRTITVEEQLARAQERPRLVPSGEGLDQLGTVGYGDRRVGWARVSPPRLLLAVGGDPAWLQREPAPSVERELDSAVRAAFDEATATTGGQR